jgi:hypothetical protein
VIANKYTYVPSNISRLPNTKGWDKCIENIQNSRDQRDDNKKTGINRLLNSSQKKILMDAIDINIY